jgi:type IV secretion system protein VirB5
MTIAGGKVGVVVSGCLMTLMGLQVAHAQFAVIDVAAVTQLVTQLRTLQQQLTTARDQLTQAHEQLQSMRGHRGMERLLAGTVRNYLPVDGEGLNQVIRGDEGVFGAMAQNLRRTIAADAVLSAEQLTPLPSRQRQLIETGRESAALLQVLTQEALATSSARFQSVQQLIDAIAGADDQKGILDLQARIDAETGMLQNEQIKLQVLYQAAQARQWSVEQRRWEQGIAGYGRFTSRFQPVAR